MRPYKFKALQKERNPFDALIDRFENVKIGMHARVKHQFRNIQRQFGYSMVRYQHLNKNTLQF